MSYVAFSFVICHLLCFVFLPSRLTGDIGHYYYGPGHPMKPHRLKLAHHLLLSYNLYREMDVYRPHLATGPVSYARGNSSACSHDHTLVLFFSAHVRRLAAFAQGFHHRNPLECIIKKYNRNQGSDLVILSVAKKKKKI